MASTLNTSTVTEPPPDGAARLDEIARETATGVPADLAPTERCRICGARVQVLRVKSKVKSNRGRAEDFATCVDCGFIACSGNTHDYSTKGFGAYSQPSTPNGTRVGDGLRPGREFHMAVMGREILRRPAVDILIYGAGLSRDFELLANEPGFNVVAITDLENYSGSRRFVPINARGPKFDLIVCCEVMEHFNEPLKEFAQLFQFAHPTSLVICSTNVHDGTPMDRLAYPFIRGHVAYYSPESVARLAAHFDLWHDFRLPKCSLGGPGPRKRYILFHHDAAVRSLIANFFGTHPYAYSEE